MKKTPPLLVQSVAIGPGQPLAFILGPCVLESESHAMLCAQHLHDLSKAKKFPLIFKASYDKANRSAHDSFRGVGIEEGLRILDKIRRHFSLPVLTDVHRAEDALKAAQVCDIIQIPAFLCRQTDLLLAAGRSGAVVNVKKGQFMAPWDLSQVIEKLYSAGCQKILLTDRGASFGYNNLVSDMRALPLMAEMGHPTCFDASHSVQLPGALGKTSGGERRFIPTLARAAVAAGADALFLECHPHPEIALSDSQTVYPFALLDRLVESLLSFRETYLRWTR